jgi:hypothetical protein
MEIDTVSSPEMPGFVELGISPRSVEVVLQQMPRGPAEKSSGIRERPALIPIRKRM